MIKFSTVKKIIYDRMVEMEQDIGIVPSGFASFKDCIDHSDLIDLLVEYGFSPTEASNFVFESIVDMKS